MDGIPLSVFNGEERKLPGNSSQDQNEGEHKPNSATLKSCFRCGSSFTDHSSHVSENNSQQHDGRMLNREEAGFLIL